VVARATEMGWKPTVTTTGGEGFLASLPGVRHQVLRSPFGRPGILPGWFAWIALQMEECALLLGARWKGTRFVWFNTLYHPLPTLLARGLFARRVVHVHEVPRPPLLGRFLARFAALGADTVLLPSESARRQLGLERNPRSRVVPNSVDPLPDPTTASVRFGERRVVLAASLGRFKGAHLLVELARHRPDLRFRLAVGSGPDEVRRVLGDLPPNLELLCGSRDRAAIFGDASVVVCLTIPRMREETFGLAVAEAMAWGIPAVVPPVGGVAERVREGIDGFHADPEDLGAVGAALDRILVSEETFGEFSRSARTAGGNRGDSEKALEEILRP